MHRVARPIYLQLRRRGIRLAVVVTAVLAGAAGISYATGALAPSTATSVIQACQNGGNGNLRVVEDSSDCKKNETAISWNVVGTAGSRGPTGATGLGGPVGPAGANGVAGANGANGAPGAKGAACLPSDAACIGPKGDKGDPGAAGANGADGSACLPSNPLCVGPKGDPGLTGAAGAQGLQGPAGSGATLASLDSLNGIACNAAGAPGTIVVSYGAPPNGATSIACKPSSTPVLTTTTTGAGIGTIASEPAGIACGATCAYGFTTGTVVTLTATTTNDIFTGWSGACTGAGYQCNVTMDAAKTVTANFIPGADLVIYQYGGNTFPANCGAAFPSVSQCDGYSTSVSIYSDSVGFGSRFLDCFYRSNRTADPASPFSSDCFMRFPRGATVHLTADMRNTPSLTWGGACSGSTVLPPQETGSSYCTLTLDTSKTVSASYGPQVQ
jgi:hypothetical protein